MHHFFDCVFDNVKRSVQNALRRLLRRFAVVAQCCHCVLRRCFIAKGNKPQHNQRVCKGGRTAAKRSRPARTFRSDSKTGIQFFNRTVAADTDAAHVERAHRRRVFANHRAFFRQQRLAVVPKSNVRSRAADIKRNAFALRRAQCFNAQNAGSRAGKHSFYRLFKRCFQRQRAAVRL